MKYYIYYSIETKGGFWHDEFLKKIRIRQRKPKWEDTILFEWKE